MLENEENIEDAPEEEIQTEFRLDALALKAELFDTRTRAENYIKEFGLLVDGKNIKKPGKKFEADAKLELSVPPLKWVSRAALKLIEALDRWDVKPAGQICLDVGSSTGGFTEVLIDRGATKVYAVDTGTAQLHPSLHNVKEIISMEQTDIRTAGKLIPEASSLIVVDVSFISLERIFPTLRQYASPESTIITLFKPQFEVGKAFVRKNGIVKDENRVIKVRNRLIENADLCGIKHWKTIDSPVTGGDGNKEYLMLWKFKT
ncbi:MAG: 23S rRNA (cytidine1920-2'-O)/16S rRNA (cytidine1409-2'-O)-methyltransferase [Flavobacteriales bacterium]|jgi:23S rRNA (cytidine1920-2'-O)/16S rRNA (cytidine1409-2'-O)-methyltransferase